MICIFDCESVPDSELIEKVHGYKGSEFDIIDQALCSQEEATGSSFLPVSFHKIISISATITDEFGRFKKVGNFGEGSREEKDILNSFLNFIDSSNPRLVSFNGRNFDIPTILVRAMKHSLQAKAYFETDNKSLNKSKWENYRQRYSENFHLDLMDSIGNFGAARGLKLDELCKLTGAPGKYDVSGDNVYELYKNSKFDKIDEYCQSDTLNTYWLFLKYELLKGFLTLQDYQEILNDFFTKLPDEKSYTPFFQEAIKKEIEGLS